MRTSIRRFDHTKPLTDDLLSRLLEEAAHAPNTGNMQLYSVVVSRTPATIAALAPAHFSQPASTGAQAMLTFCADYNRYSRWCRLNGADPGCDNLESFMTATIDAVIFAQEFNRLAEAEGLGCCYLGTTTYNAPMIAETLGLPRGVVPIATIAVGWPAETPAPTDRLPVEAIVHFERYADPTDAEIAATYAAKEQLPDNKRFVEENGKSNLAQVYAEVRYPRANAEHFSRLLHDLIVRDFPMPEGGSRE